MAFQLNRTQLLVVKFSCRTTPARPTEPQKKNVIAALRQLWPEQFEGEVDPRMPLQAAQPPLLVMQRRYYLSQGFGEAPSFFLFPDSVEIPIVRRLQYEDVAGAATDPWAEDPSLLHKVRSSLQKLQELLPNYRYHRTAQVFELAVGPFIESEKLALQHHLVGKNDPELGEVRCVLTRYQKQGNRVYNHRIEAGFIQNALSEPVMVTAKVEANNRAMNDSLDPQDMEAIWRHGREIRDTLLSEVFPPEA